MRAGRGGKAILVGGCGWEAFPEDQEEWGVYPGGWLGLGGPPGQPEGVRRPSWSARRGWESLPEGREGSGREGSGGVRKPSRRTGKCMEALSGVYGGPLRGPRVVGRPPPEDGRSGESILEDG